MNALLRHKSCNLRANYLLQNIYKRYGKSNCCSACSSAHLGKEIKTGAADGRPRRCVSASALDIGRHNPRRFQSPSTFGYHYSGHGFRNLHTSRTMFETSSSKIDVTVKKLKNQQKEKVEEIMKEVANGNQAATAAANNAVAAATASSTEADNNKEKGTVTGTDAVASSTTTVATPADKTVAKPKKPLRTRIWDELVHYYHGFRLLFIDVAICSKLLWRVLNGKTLTRRENKQLQRTTSDLFRLIPFSVFIVVPFMELLLPLFIKFFPGMLPSTFQTANDRQEKLRQSLAVRLEVAKFLQRTLDQMPVQHKEHSSEEAKQFEAFFTKIRDPGDSVSNDEIIKFAKRFDDEITLDSLSREQLGALCRVLELNTIGTTTLLRFQLRLKLRSLATDDRVIAREGVDSLDLFELQQACKARGMRAYGLTAERLRFQLKEWIDLSLNEQVPPTLLLLSRAMLISDDRITTDKLKETMRVLPDAVGAHTRHAIGESEGKVDNKTKIEIIKEEERKIQEEREEEQEETIAKRSAIKEEQAAPYVFTENLERRDKDLLDQKENLSVSETDKGISSTDVQLLSDALKTLSSDKQLVVEKETIKELKEELADYKEDVEELREVRQVVKEPVRESRAAKLLYNRVNKMISNLDSVLNDLEHRQNQIKQVDSSDYVVSSPAHQQMVHIDELVATIRRVKEASDEERLKVVEDLLVKLDSDKDGVISVQEITKAVQSIDGEATKIDKKQLEEFTALLSKQATRRRKEEIVRIDDLMKNIKMLKETSDEARLKHIEGVLEKFDADKDGVVTVNDIRRVMESIGRDNIKLSNKAIEELITLLDKEQILQAEQKIEKAIAKSMKEAEKLKTEVDKTDKEITKLVDGIHDSAKEIRDIANELGASDDKLKDNAKTLKSEPAQKDTAKTLKDKAPELNDVAAPKKTSETKPKAGPMAACSGPTTEAVIREATERQMGKILPSADIDLPPTIQTPTQPPTSKKSTATANLSSSSNSKKLL